MSQSAQTESEAVIPLSVPALRGNEWKYIKECLDTNWVSYAGPFVNRFERELAAKVGAKHAVATASGTAALHICLLLAGVGQNDEVVMPAVTFVAAANGIRYCGAWPALIDISPNDWQLDVAQLERFLADGCEYRGGRLINKATGRRVAALLPVHLLGGLADVDAVAELATKYELPLVEDAAECLGATYKGRPIAAPCPAYRGPMRLVITSFNGNKIITTSGGGAIFTDDPSLAAHAKHLTTTAKADKIEFFHDEVGYNYRLTNIAAALGVAQLEKLGEYVEIKRGIAGRYAEFLKNNPHIKVHPEPRHCRSTFWMYSLMLDRVARPVIDSLNREGVMSRPIWIPIHKLPAFSGGAFRFNVTTAEALYRCGLSLPCSVGITEAQVGRVLDLLLDGLVR
jgi:perosamine synthetase